jgi:hypothetical protein
LNQSPKPIGEETHTCCTEDAERRVEFKADQNTTQCGPADTDFYQRESQRAIHD